MTTEEAEQTGVLAEVGLSSAVGANLSALLGVNTNEGKIMMQAGKVLCHVSTCQRTECKDTGICHAAISRTEELLGCPFCGGTPKYSPEADSVAHTGQGWPHQLTHNCPVFETQMLVRVPRKTGTKADLFHKWNSRQPVDT